MKFLILFLLLTSVFAFADSKVMPKTSQIPETPANEVNLEKMNTSPNPVQNSEDESSDAILNPNKNPEVQQMQEDDGEDESGEGQGEEDQGEYQGKIKG